MDCVEVPRSWVVSSINICQYSYPLQSLFVYISENQVVAIIIDLIDHTVDRNLMTDIPISQGY